MKNNPHLIYVINQASRKGEKARHTLKCIVEKKNYSYEIHITKEKGHAKKLIPELAESIDATHRVVVVGGDGTLNEAISGLQESGMDRPIGYIASGSGNDFARSNDLPKNIEKALTHLLSLSSPRRLDVLKIIQDDTIRYAVNSTGVGIDGRVIQQVESKRSKQKIGSLSYFSAIYSAAQQQEPFQLSIKTVKESIQFPQALLALAVNNKYIGGGIPVHPNASANDQKIQVVVVEKVTVFELIHILFKIVTGARHLRHKKVHQYECSKPILHISPDQFGQQDGELLEVSSTPFQVRTVPQQFWI